MLEEGEASLPDSMDDMVFPGRRIKFPITVNDSWNREALRRYMESIRDKAVYLPSNIRYLGKNNGLTSGSKALSLLTSSPYVSSSSI